MAMNLWGNHIGVTGAGFWDTLCDSDASVLPKFRTYLRHSDIHSSTALGKEMGKNREIPSPHGAALNEQTNV